MSANLSTKEIRCCASCEFIGADGETEGYCDLLCDEGIPEEMYSARFTNPLGICDSYVPHESPKEHP